LNPEFAAAEGEGAEADWKTAAIRVAKHRLESVLTLYSQAEACAPTSWTWGSREIS